MAGLPSCNILFLHLLNEVNIFIPSLPAVSQAFFITLIFREPQRVSHRNSRDSLNGHAVTRDGKFLWHCSKQGSEPVYWFPSGGGIPTTRSTACAQMSDLHVPHCMFIPIYYFLNNYFHKHMPKSSFLVAEQCSTAWI